MRILGASVAVAMLAATTAMGAPATAPVAEAAKRDDAAAIKVLVARGADVNAPLPDGATALHWAVQWNNDEVVDLLLRARAAVNARNDYGIAPLSLACTNRSAVLVERLLSAGADPNVTADTGETALMTCAYTGNAAAVSALLKAGADPNRREKLEAQTALMWAATQGYAEAVRLLLAAGADVQARSRVRSHFICYTTQCGNGDSGGFSSGQKYTARISRGGYTALLFAARSGDVATVTALLDRGAPIEEQGADGYTPLLLATHGGHTTLTRFLLERGARPDASGVGYTALHTAVLRGDLAATEALVQAGADINARITKPAPMERFTDKWMVLPVTVVGYTPLQLAARYVEVPILRFLLVSGADRQVMTTNGTTPLMDLVGLGINRNGSTDRRGRSVDVALVTLLNSDDVPILEGVRVLLEAGADIKAVNENGDTALHGAAALGMRRVYDLLVSAGADPDVRNKRRQSPRLLIENGDTLLAAP